MLLILGLCMLPCMARTSLTIIFSSETPKTLSTEVVNSLNSGTLGDYPFQIFTADEEEIPDFSTDLLVDFSYSVKIAYVLREMAERLDSILIEPMIPTESLAYSSHVFYTHPPLLSHSQALSLLLKGLGWSSFYTTLSTSHHSRTIASILRANLKLTNYFIEEFESIPNESDQSHFNRFIARDVKPTANWKFVVLNEEKGAMKLHQSLKNNHIYKEGCGLVIGSLASIGTYSLGTIYLAEKGSERAVDHGEREVLAISELIQSSKTGNLKKDLREAFPYGYITPEFSVMNYRTDSMVEKVGFISNGALNFTETIIYPGNVTAIPTTKPVIPFSLETGNFNYDGTPSYETQVIQLGTKVTIGLLNNNQSYLPNFQLQLHETDCGYLYDYNHFYNCYSKHKTQLGHFTVFGANELTAFGTIDIFRKLDIQAPIIGFLTYNDVLYDKQLYPEYIIPSASLIYTASILPNILQAFRWRNIVVFGTKGQKLQEYELFIQRVNDMGINILNKPEFHLFEDTYTLDQFEAHRERFQDVIDSRGLIIVIFAITPVDSYIVQGLYDVGLRAGDVQLFFNIKMKELIQNHKVFEYNLEKVMELTNGSLSIFSAEWVGEFGEWLEPIVADSVAPLGTGYLCFPIDSFLLGAYTIQTMITLGKEYENPQELNKYIRQQRFQGCSGTVSIDSASNSRSILSYSIMNFYQDKETGELIETPIGNYTIGVAVPLVISKDIVWPNDMTEPLPDMRIDPECGIPSYLIKELQKSKDLALNIYVGVLCLCQGIVFVLSFRYWCFRHKTLRRPVHMTFEDAAYMLGFVIEGFQLVTIAPGSSQFHPLLLRYMKFLIMEIELEGNDYWRALTAIASIVVIWAICACIEILVNTDCLPKNLNEYLNTIGVRLLPFISQWFYIPAVRTLFSIYRCEKAAGDDLTDAFFYKDCNIYCWKEMHLGYVIASTIALVVYISVTSLCRCYWDEYSDYSYVKTNTYFSIFRGLAFACLAGLHVLRKEEKEYSIVFWSLIGVYLVMKFAICPTNYDRMNAWLRVGIVGIVLIICVNLIGSGISSLITAGIQVAIFLVFSLLGLYLQKKYFISMFFRNKAIRVYDLFRFGLTTKVSKEEVNRRISDLKLESMDYSTKYQDDKVCVELRYKEYANNNSV